MEVNTTQTKEAYKIKNEIDSFLKNEILPGLEKLLLKHDNPNVVLRIDKLDVDLLAPGWENRDQWKAEIINQFEKQLLRQLQTGTQVSINKNQLSSIQVSGTENSEDIFLFFLESGYLPWFGNEDQIVDFVQHVVNEELQMSPSFVRRLAEVLSQKNESVERLLNQFSAELVVSFLAQLNQDLKNKKLDILLVLKNNHRMFNLEWLKILLKVSVEQSVDTIISSVNKWFNFLQKPVSGFIKKEKKETSEIFKLFLVAVSGKVISEPKFQGILNQSLAIVAMEKAVPETSEKVFIQKQKKDEPFLGENLNEIAVSNAGIILLHPFFKTFFRLLNVTDARGEIKPDKQNLAVQLLYFLATGQEDVFEATLVFEKFLCGIPLKMPVLRKSLLTPKMRNETDNLLKQLIKNWEALKNTSPDGVRQMFLQRDGKLIQNEKNFKLIMERKAQDVLLDKLNWNLSLVKIPWINNLLTVEW